MTYRNHGAVNETDAVTSSKGIKFYESYQSEEHTGHEFHKAVVCNGSWEIVHQITFDILHIVILKVRYVQK